MLNKSKAVIVLVCLSVILPVLLGCALADTGTEYEPITCVFTYDSEAMIGHPFTVHYELSGGSGSYSNLYVDASCHPSFDENYGFGCKQLYDGYLEETSGTVTIIPVAGSIIDSVFIGGIDNATGKPFTCYERNVGIPICPNDDLCIDVSFDKQRIFADESINLNYSITCSESCSDFDSVRVQFAWYASEHIVTEWEEYDDVEGIGNTPYLMTSSGELSFSPRYGDGLLLYLRGSVDNQYFYKEYGPIPMEFGEPVEYPPVTCTFTYDSEAMIGHPFTVHYELSGGSGSYSNLYVDASCYPSFDENYGFGCKQLYDGYLEETSGTVTIIPVAGSIIDSVSIDGIDNATGKPFTCFERNVGIPICPNDDLCIDVSFDKQRIFADESINLNYSITCSESCSDFDSVRVQFAWYASEHIVTEWEEYDDVEGIGNTPYLMTSSGELSFTSRYGDGLLLYLRGSVDDRYFYKEYGPIPILTPMPDYTYSFILPDDLTSIDQSAFDGCAPESVLCPAGLLEIDTEAFANNANLKKVLIPASVSYISADAFDHAPNTVIICYKGSYAEEFAKKNGIRYESYDLITK